MDKEVNYDISEVEALENKRHFFSKGEFIVNKFATCTVICFLLLSVNHVKADLMLTAVDGDWGNSVGPGTSITGNVFYNNGIADTYGNLLQDQIRWGDPADSEKSGLGFTGVVGVATPPAAIVLGDAFQIGQLAHFNEPIWSNSVIVSADLTINLIFSATESFLFTFGIGINETPNSGTSSWDDIISFPSSYPEQTLDISGDFYTLQLLGFGSDPLTLLSEFSSPEGGTNETWLWGKIEPIQTPVPGAVLLGMLGLGVAGMKLRKYA
jgi:hypothetical protein